MTGSEIRELRQRVDGLSNFKAIYYCYVNAAKQIVNAGEIPVLDMDMEEKEMYSMLIKKTLSCAVGKHLLPIEYTAEEVESNVEHRFLMDLNNTHLENEDLRSDLYEKIIENFDNEGKSYVILLASDTYDIKPKAAEDADEEAGDGDTLDSVYQHEYFVCSICKVKDSKAALKYQATKEAFRGISTGRILKDPIVGFFFPAFEKRQTDIYTVAYYTKDVSDTHEELIKGLLNPAALPFAANSKRELFGKALNEALKEDCTMELIASLQSEFVSRRAEDDEDDPNYEVSISEVGDSLRDKGIAEEKITAFKNKLSESLGGEKNITVNTITGKGNFKITSSDAEISVPQEQAIRLKTTVIDGVKYFLVPVGADVKANGLPVNIDKTGGH